MARRTTTRSRRRPSDDMPDEERFEPNYEDLDDEPDEDDDPPSRSRRRSRRGSSSGEDEAPRGRRAGRSRGRDRDDADDEDDRPRRERGRSSSAGRGWSGYAKVKSSSSEYVNSWKVPDRPTLIKFLEPEPFYNFAQHWLDELPKGTKKSYVCLGDDCPLCDDLGDRPAGYALFNILDLSDPDNPKNEFLQASTGLSNQIETFANEKRSKPIDRWDGYFAIHREKKKGARYQLEFVKARDLEEDWDVEPFSEDELEEYQDGLVTEEQAVFIDSRTRLKEVVDMIEDYD